MELAISDWNKEIKRRAKKKLLYKENEIIYILNQIIDALLYLENEGIAHRDIKPQNILLFKNNIFKVADFGEAKKFNDVSQECTLRGSELYMSPILYNGLKLCQKDVVHNAFKSDVFSLSFCLIYALSLNLSILNEIREINNMAQISNIIQRNFKRNYSQYLITLILKMINLNEKERFSFSDIKNYLNEKYN
jgi:serine/threonine protein kinase